MSRFEVAFRVFLGLEVLALALYGTPAFFWAWLLPAVVFAALFLAGLFRPQLGFFLPLLNRVETEEPVVYLTFDDGPHPETTALLLDYLRAEGIDATFFVVGARVQAHRELLLRIVEEGHQVGNHSMNHRHGAALSSAKRWRAELEEADRAIEAVLHWRPRLFRPPVGITTPSLAKALQGGPRQTVGWTKRLGDWFGKDAQAVARRLVEAARPGAVFTLHDHPHPGASALEVLKTAVPELKRRGYRFASLPSPPV